MAFKLHNLPWILFVLRIVPCLRRIIILYLIIISYLKPYNWVQTNKYNQGIGLVGFYGISTLVGYLMPNPVHTYMFNKYDLAWLWDGLVR